jgi:hypothetical protein
VFRKSIDQRECVELIAFGAAGGVKLFQLNTITAKTIIKFMLKNQQLH